MTKLLAKCAPPLLANKSKATQRKETVREKKGMYTFWLFKKAWSYSICYCSLFDGVLGLWLTMGMTIPAERAAVISATKSSTTKCSASSIF
jgi:hypothetical protein